MKKYRIKKSKEMDQWDANYYARECWDVQQRFLWFFWITIKGFWDEHLAKKYMQAKIELDESKPEIL
jgi:hypothetical protein